MLFKLTCHFEASPFVISSEARNPCHSSQCVISSATAMDGGSAENARSIFLPGRNLWLKKTKKSILCWIILKLDYIYYLGALPDAGNNN